MKRIVSLAALLALISAVSFFTGCFTGKDLPTLPGEAEMKIEIKHPLGVAVDGMDRKIVANTGMDQVLVLDKDFNPVGVITGITKGGKLSEPHGVAADSSNRIIVADTGNSTVKIYNKDGYFKKAIGEPGSGPGQFNRPEGVATDSEDNIFVFDSGNKRVQVFNESGKYLFEFSSGQYSYERLTGKMEEPKVETMEGEITLDHPVRGTIMPGNRIVIADFNVGKYSVWEYDIDNKSARPLQYVEPMDNFPDYLAGDVAYNPVFDEMCYLRAGFPLTNVDFLEVAKVDGKELAKVPYEQKGLKDQPYEWAPSYRTNGTFRTRFFEPRGVAVDSEGNAVVALAVQNRVLEIPHTEIEGEVDPFNPLKLRIVESTSSTLTIEYDTEENVETRVQFGPLEGEYHFGEPLDPQAFTQDFYNRSKTQRHKVELYDLFPATRYVFRFLTSHRSFPKDNYSNTFIASTNAPGGEAEHLNLPIQIVLFTNIVELPDPDKLPKDDSGNAVLPEEPGPMTEEQIGKVKEQLELARMFYWVNSHMKLNMQFHYIIDDTRYEGIPFSRYGYYPNADREKLDKILRDNGVEPKGMGGGVCVIYGIRKYDPVKGEWFMPGSGGNTWALPHDGAGISVWNAGGDNGWLFGHEYGHQLDIMSNNSGHKYHFNHFHWNDLPGDYGSHWDGNAYIAREFKPSSYLANLYGTLAVSVDADDDGIPDDDPSVPLDEKRFGTKTYISDSDYDGLDDLEEIMSASWLFDAPTIGGRMVGPVFRPQPSNTDTDGDGIGDGHDPYPLYPVATDALRRSITVDGVFSNDEWAPRLVRVIDDPDAKGSFHINWDDKYLYFALVLDAPEESTVPPEMRIELDCQNDGFTVGSDNLTISTAWNDAEKSLVVKTNYNDTSIRKQPVWKDNEIPLPENVLISWTKYEGKFVVEMGVPQTPVAGLNLFAGEEIGFDLSFKPATEKTWLMIFEPQALFDFVLRE